ncbi:MAG: hypothetical protein JNK84_21560 [Phreatobacter sp.]|uniref:hypothetical protein n=1 Tax=Phreatobacter sp. TaxID=1966341 RepID=UPI001A4EB878|nr:hypothetical protein [Phreatobacter sp.]MBL8571670.1 hypothetical protein [Phreatobacter sp.]
MKIAATIPWALGTGLAGAVMLAAWLGSTQELRPAAVQGDNNACPPGYSTLRGYCWHPLSGDVVDPIRPPTGPAPARSAAEMARPCAAPDLAAWTLIEQHGDDRSLPSQALADAFFAIMEARRACRAGRSDEALAIYARVTTRLGNVSR